MAEWVYPPSISIGSLTLLLIDLPFYKQHPKLTGGALCVTGAVILAPVTAAGVLGAAGFTSAGVAAGN